MWDMGVDGKLEERSNTPDRQWDKDTYMKGLGGRSNTCIYTHTYTPDRQYTKMPIQGGEEYTCGEEMYNAHKGINMLTCIMPVHTTTHMYPNGGSTCTCLFSKSILLPRTTKGKFSGSLGLAWIRNSSLQLSNVLNEFAFVTSYTSTQQSAPL